MDPSKVSVAAADPPKPDLDTVNDQLTGATPARVISWAAETFGQGLVMTSSFGAQAAVMLHLVTRVLPRVPVILIDTGYLFPETYRFAEQLGEQLGLNLKVFQSDLTPARYEALYGKDWEQGAQGIERYNTLRKVQPLRRAIRELGATSWLAGLRRQQTDHRASLRTVELQDGVYKIHPILEWTSKDVHDYLTEHGLPYHPLYEKGYKSIGDTHTTVAITEQMDEREGRFQGLRQECGIHLPTTAEERESRDASGL